MIRITFLLSVLILLIGCKENEQSKSYQDEPNAKLDSASSQHWTSLAESLKDTILERSSPRALDLTKHQIFIDTTRNSKFYQSLKNWKESIWDKKAINSTLNLLNEDFKPIQVDLKSFPNHFITLRKLNDQFVLYDRCDGIDPRFEIRDSVFIIYGPLESHAEPISRMISITDDSIELELKTFQLRSHDEKSRLNIKRVEDFIYKLSYSSLYNGKTYIRNEYLTTIDAIQKFDLVVNNCPIIKVREFDGFDE